MIDFHEPYDSCDLTDMDVEAKHAPLSHSCG